MFWFGIFVVVALVIGASVLIGKMLSRPRAPGAGDSRRDRMMALKASGALSHRKSNRP